MKNLIFIAFLILPLISFAQKKESWRLQSEQRRAAERVAYQRPVTFKNNLDEGGFHIQRAGSFLIGGSLAEILGAGLIVAGDGEGSTTVAGGVLAGVGLILQIVGYSQIQKGGRLIRGVAFTRKGLSINL